MPLNLSVYPSEAPTPSSSSYPRLIDVICVVERCQDTWANDDGHRCLHPGQHVLNPNARAIQHSMSEWTGTQYRIHSFRMTEWNSLWENVGAPDAIWTAELGQIEASWIRNGIMPFWHSCMRLIEWNCSKFISGCCCEPTRSPVHSMSLQVCNREQREIAFGWQNGKMVCVCVCVHTRRTVWLGQCFRICINYQIGVNGMWRRMCGWHCPPHSRSSFFF